MYTPNTTIAGPSNGSPEDWIDTAKARGAKRISDVEKYIREVYRLAPMAGIRAEIVIVQSMHETDSWRSYWWTERLNPAGLGITGDKNQDNVSRTFPSGVESARAHIVHLYLYAVGKTLPDTLKQYQHEDPRWDAAVGAGYAGKAKTIGGLTNTWAVDSKYGDKLVRHLNDHVSEAVKDAVEAVTPPKQEDSAMGFNVGNRPLRVAVGVGHANTSGGNPVELAINRRVMKALLELDRDSDGFDIRCYTPNDGQGTYPGGLDDVIYGTVHKWMPAWKPDVIFEIHHQGVSNASYRGLFIIYPDSVGLQGRKAAGGDFIDIDVRDTGNAMAKILSNDLGFPLWGGDGVMSERETGVGGQGWRLGYFGALSDAYFQENCCVFISEAGTFTNPTELAAMQKADFPAKEARGLLKAVAHLAKTRGNWTYNYAIGAGKPIQSPPPAPVVAPQVVSIPELDKFANTGADNVPGFVDFALEGKPYRAIFIGDQWQASKNTPRYGVPDKADRLRNGGDIKQGEKFDVRWVVFRKDAAPAHLYGRTPWGTFVDMYDTNRVGDILKG